MSDYTANMRKNTKIVLLILGIFVFISGFIAVSRKTIVFQLEDEITEYKTFAHTVEDFLKEKEIQVKEKGYINYPLDAKLENNMHLVIKEPKTYDIQLGEEIKKGLISPHTEVGEILKDLGIHLDQKDYTEPALEKQVSDGSLIKVYKVKEVLETKEVEIPYETITKDSKNLDKGELRLVQAGVLGKKTQEIKTTYINGKAEKVDLVKESIITNPVTELKERGTRQLVATSRGKTNFKKSLVMTATAYDDTPQSQGKWVGRTATGVKPRHGIAAVDPRVIPLGTKLYVEGYGECIAADTGGAIKGNRIDLFFNSSRDVRNFGRRQVKVYIL